MLRLTAKYGNIGSVVRLVLACLLRCTAISVCSLGSSSTTWLASIQCSSCRSALEFATLHSVPPRKLSEASTSLCTGSDSIKENQAGWPLQCVRVRVRWLCWLRASLTRPCGRTNCTSIMIATPDYRSLQSRGVDLQSTRAAEQLTASRPRLPLRDIRALAKRPRPSVSVAGTSGYHGTIALQ